MSTHPQKPPTQGVGKLLPRRPGKNWDVRIPRIAHSVGYDGVYVAGLDFVGPMKLMASLVDYRAISC